MLINFDVNADKLLTLRIWRKQKMSDCSYKICVELQDEHIDIINNALDLNMSVDDDIGLSEAVLRLIELVGEMI